MLKDDLMDTEGYFHVQYLWKKCYVKIEFGVFKLFALPSFCCNRHEAAFFFILHIEKIENFTCVYKTYKYFAKPNLKHENL